MLTSEERAKSPGRTSGAHSWSEMVCLGQRKQEERRREEIRGNKHLISG